MNKSSAFILIHILYVVLLVTMSVNGRAQVMESASSRSTDKKAKSSYWFETGYLWLNKNAMTNLGSNFELGKNHIISINYIRQNRDHYNSIAAHKNHRNSRVLSISYGFSKSLNSWSKITIDAGPAYVLDRTYTYTKRPYVNSDPFVDLLLAVFTFGLFNSDNGFDEHVKETTYSGLIIHSQLLAHSKNIGYSLHPYVLFANNRTFSGMTLSILFGNLESKKSKTKS